MNRSQFIDQAKDLVDSIRGTSGVLEERIDLSIRLAGLLLRAAREGETWEERSLQKQLAGMMKGGKVFTTSLADQSFRSHDPARVADQMCWLMDHYGIPSFLPWYKQWGLFSFYYASRWAPKIMVPLAVKMIRKEMSGVILPGEHKALSEHMYKRREKGVRVNLNHLGEAILGEEEALRRLGIYLDALKQPEIEYVSIKISTICSQINLLAWKETLELLKERLRQLYRTASSHFFIRKDGSKVPKFVNLDMEEYRDLNLTVAVFQEVLEEDEFLQHEAGIVLQSYIPDSFSVLKNLTRWAQERVRKGGAPIKVRIVKGANLAMEQVEASLHGWTQAPYSTKAEVDANFKRMVTYACEPSHAKVVHVGIGSHNLFDISYALLLRAVNEVEPYVGMEMLEGMADSVRRSVHEVAGDMLVYCPAAREEEFQNAVAYLIRRLDENTGEENFLRHSFDLQEGNESWKKEVERFQTAFQQMDSVADEPRRTQNRLHPPQPSDPQESFQNEPDTDFSLPQNIQWAQGIADTWQQLKFPTLPLYIGGEEIVLESHRGKGKDPSRPGRISYTFSLAQEEHAERALATAMHAQKSWEETSIEERSRLLFCVAEELRKRRGDLIGAMMLDGGKLVKEADPEVSEAIDFAEYYRRSLLEHHELKGIQWKAKGAVLVTPPWNFPCAIPLGCVLAALVTGNTVILKPAPETVLVSWLLMQICYDAGIPKKVLQFLPCEEEPVGSSLIRDQRIQMVVLTGATSTAELFLNLRPDLDLVGETGGKNAMIVTRLADRDLAVKNVIQSAFGHGGQKCSATSLLICEREVYEDEQFRKQLWDAAKSLHVGSVWDLQSEVNPLIHPPRGELKWALEELDEGEEWLLQPKQDEGNSHLWSPGIKWGVREGSRSHQKEFFGPVLSVLCAEDLSHALRIANGTDYGLTSGLQSLDPREQEAWKKGIIAGNCYINRGTTGAIVRRQPFGGTKSSGFGQGRKAGGPHYLSQFMIAEEKELPRAKGRVSEDVRRLREEVRRLLSEDEVRIWEASARHYQEAYEVRFSKEHDPSQCVGQDNLLRFVPLEKLCVRVGEGTSLLDVLRICAAALTCGTKLVFSGEGELGDRVQEVLETPSVWSERTLMQYFLESEEELAARLGEGEIRRLRALGRPREEILRASVGTNCRVVWSPVYANGYLELLQYVREVSLSVDYHRYGNLGDREVEKDLSVY